MVYLGLVDDEEYEEYEPYDEPQTQPLATAPPPRRGAARSVPDPMEGSYDPEPSGVRTLPRDEGLNPALRGVEPRVADPRNLGGSGMGSAGGMGGSGAVTVQPRPSVVRPFSQPQAAKVHITVPVGFNDAQEIGDKLKDNQPVIVNLQGIDRDLSRRLIDFSSGLTYGLGGAMERVAEQVFLLTPSNVEVSAEEKRRLQERGLYRA
ncbi:MAG TPA: cell division protein SepF [Acidimicrobiales bacterium]|nr:cell division protein SepF [Acidimicrobiales bacterium]